MALCASMAAMLALANHGVLYDRVAWVGTVRDRLQSSAGRRDWRRAGATIVSEARPTASSMIASRPGGDVATR